MALEASWSLGHDVARRDFVMVFQNPKEFLLVAFAIAVVDGIQVNLVLPCKHYPCAPHSKEFRRRFRCSNGQWVTNEQIGRLIRLVHMKRLLPKDFDCRLENFKLMMFSGHFLPPSPVELLRVKKEGPRGRVTMKSCGESMHFERCLNNDNEFHKSVGPRRTLPDSRILSMSISP